MRNTTKTEYSWKEVIAIIWYFIREDRRKYVIWVFILGLVYLYPLVPPFLMGVGIDLLSNYKVGDSLNLFYIVAVTYGVTHGIVSILRLTAKEQLSFISSRTHYNIRTEAFNKLMDFSAKWHNQENSGNKIQKIISGSDAVQQMMKNFYNSKGVFQATVGLLSILVVFFVLDLKFLLFLLIYTVAIIIVEYIYYQKIYEANVRLNIAAEKSSGTYFENTSNLLTVKTLGLKSTMDTKVKSNEETVKQRTMLESKLGHTKWKYFQVLNAIGYIIFFLLILDGFLAGIITVGFILIYFKYFEDLKAALMDLSDLVTLFSQQKAKAVRMMPTFKDEIESSVEVRGSFPSDWKSIILKNISFSYSMQGKESTLKNITVEIPRYSTVGIVGQSGSGKSTIAKLLLGVYEIDKGSYKIGKTNYYTIDKADLHKNMSTVLQETELFNMSLKENITMMKDGDPELLQKAFDIAQLGDMIKNLPEGMETMIGEKGYRLSGGERQRVGIARAIYQNTEILVLDEATSSLDSRTEELIQKKLESELDKKTMIVIAHRLSTLKNVDKIYVFEKGKIVEQGSFKSLVANKGSIFAKMYQIQKGK